MSESKQVAVLQGEVDGLVCKLNGYERALQDCELQVGSAFKYSLTDSDCVAAKGGSSHFAATAKPQAELTEFAAHSSSCTAHICYAGMPGASLAADRVPT
jgi:hypothetical protein